MISRLEMSHIRSLAHVTCAALIGLAIGQTAYEILVHLADELDLQDIRVFRMVNHTMHFSLCIGLSAIGAFTVHRRLQATLLAALVFSNAGLLAALYINRCQFGWSLWIDQCILSIHQFP